MPAIAPPLSPPPLDDACGATIVLPSVPTGVTNGTVEDALPVDVDVEVTVTTVPLVGLRGTTAD